MEWNSRILVPFAPETDASGIGDTSFFSTCWYRRTLSLPELSDGRLLLHFGAVDYEATVWVDGQRIACHEGGYTPFDCDVSEWAGRSVELVVRADDDPQDLAKPRGKQDWQLEPHSIWYPRTTGVWQTVWTEVVPAELDRQRSVDAESRAMGDRAATPGLRAARRDGLRLHVTLNVGRRSLPTTPTRS